MALPTTRRPVIVEEELKIDSIKSNKIKVDIKKVFMDSMISWYINELKGKRRASRLTARKLKKKAVHVLFSLRYEYDRLPLNWVEKLIEATGMKLYERIKQDFSYLKDQGISVKVDPLVVQPNKSLVGKFEENYKFFPEEQQNGTMMEGSYIDLTHEPPPSKWLGAYLKGEHIRREITIYPGTDKTIIFYDYEPKFKVQDTGESLSLVPQPVHDGNSFTWFSDYKQPLSTPGNKNYF